MGAHMKVLNRDDVARMAVEGNWKQRLEAQRGAVTGVIPAGRSTEFYTGLATGLDFALDALGRNTDWTRGGREVAGPEMALVEAYLGLIAELLGNANASPTPATAEAAAVRQVLRDDGWDKAQLEGNRSAIRLVVPQGQSQDFYTGLAAGLQLGARTTANISVQLIVGFHAAVVAEWLQTTPSGS